MPMLLRLDALSVRDLEASTNTTALISTLTPLHILLNHPLSATADKYNGRPTIITRRRSKRTASKITLGMVLNPLTYYAYTCC